MMQRRVLAALAVAVALVGAACSSATQPSTTTVAAQGDVVFGKGEVPETVPEDFPVPQGSVVGSTLIDRSRGLTEMVLTIPADVPSAASYFEANLPAAGFTIASSDGTDAEWTIAFVGDELEGDVILKVGGTGVSAAVVRLRPVG